MATRVAPEGGAVEERRCVSANCCLLEVENARLDAAAIVAGPVVRGIGAARQPTVLSLQVSDLSGPREVWARYQTGAGGPLLVSIAANPAGGRGVLAPSNSLAWRPLTDDRGRRVQIDLSDQPSPLILSTALAEGDQIDSLALVDGTAPLPGIEAVIDIASVWTGTHVGFVAVQDQGKTFVGYYDADRWMTVAEVDLATLAVRHVRLPSRFEGWDNHNAIQMAFDRQGLLHVAGNMHATPLVYFRAAPPYREGDFLRVPMVGRDEARVTYPRFLRSEDNALFFTYRSGGSGDGAWLLNQWNGSAWTRATARPIFAARDASGALSAYPSRFVRGSDSSWHVVVVWRRRPDAAMNFRLTYARSTDLMNWTRSDGQPIELPLGPDNMDVVTNTGVAAGLVNNAQLAIDPQGRPVVTFTRYAPDGNNSVYLARAEGHGAWSIRPAGLGTRRQRFEGAGSLPWGIPLTSVDFADPDQPAVEFRLPGVPQVRQRLDPRTLEPKGAPMPAGQQALSMLVDTSAKLANPVMSVEQVQRPDGAPSGYLIWRAQGANNDRPWACDTVTPLACQPPSSLLRLVLPQAPGG
jgi:hypothetical protein